MVCSSSSLTILRKIRYKKPTFYKKMPTFPHVCYNVFQCVIVTHCNKKTLI